MDSVEKALGLNPRGDGALSESLDKVWNSEGVEGASERLGEGEGAESGGVECIWLFVSLACELGDDAASGLAIRRPPRD